MRKKLYVETSVWNQLTHVDRPEWRTATQRFIETIKAGYYEIFVSNLVMEEISRISNQELLKELLEHLATVRPTVLYFNEEAKNLVDQYIAAGIIKSIKPKIIIDLGHVAMATVNDVRHIISFNFDHLVNEVKIDKFNAVNLSSGYDAIVDIKTPESYIIRKEEL